MHGGGPFYGDGHVETVQLGRAVMTFVYAEETYGLAIAMRRQRIELTGAAIGAVAVPEFEAMDFPLSHQLLLNAKEDTRLSQQCGATHSTTRRRLFENAIIGRPD
jgi:hypothetical protein